MPVQIIIDSTTDLAPDFQPRPVVLPLTIHFGNQSFLDGVELSHQGFYEHLVESDQLPTTSQVTPYAFAQAFARARQAGRQVVAITISAKLSGTYQSAVLAAREFPGDVFVVDSHSVTIGAGILVEYATGLAQSGLSAREIAQAVEQERDKVQLVALLDTLEYLKRGGRISKTVALAGSLLSIKPVVSLNQGEVELLGKARGSRQGNNMLVQRIAAAGGVDFSRPVLLGYTGLSDALLQKYIQDSRSLWAGHIDHLPVTTAGGAIGTHVGPGAIAVAFFQP